MMMDDIYSSIYHCNTIYVSKFHGPLHVYNLSIFKEYLDSCYFYIFEK